jgi:hypothetical protein
MAGLAPETTLISLKQDNNELYSKFYSIKKKFTALRVLTWVVVLREAIICVLQFSYIIDLSKTTTFQQLNYFDRSFFECLIDLFEFLGLCWLLVA